FLGYIVRQFRSGGFYAQELAAIRGARQRAMAHVGVQLLVLASLMVLFTPPMELAVLVFDVGWTPELITFMGYSERGLGPWMSPSQFFFNPLSSAPMWIPVLN